MQYINALRNVVSPEQAINIIEHPAYRGVVTKTADVRNVNELQVEKSNVVLLSEPIGDEYTVQYGGCTGSALTTDVEPVEEIRILRALTERKLFTNRVLTYMPLQSQWEKFMELGNEFKYQSGDVILAQGDRKQFLYFLQSGKCRVTSEIQNYATKTLDTYILRGLEPDDFFGLECFLLGGESSYTVESITDNATVLMFDPERVNELFSRETALAGGFTKYFCCCLYELLGSTPSTDNSVRFRTTSV